MHDFGSQIIGGVSPPEIEEGITLTQKNFTRK